MNNTGVEIGFYEFLFKKQNHILIPKIQRDYVQGRENLRVKRNRESFIKELVSSICENKKVNLNFIYGYNDNFGRFIPIDGQQRLTTLFLLHAYIFARNKEYDALKYLKDNFSYETRNSSKTFFELLLKYFICDDLCTAPNNLPKESEEELLNAIKSTDEEAIKSYTENKFKLEQLKFKTISNRIENCKWFSARWKQDPTVYSALVVLDEIESAFKDYTDFNNCSNNLKQENCPIKFMILKIEEIGKPEELYIKMNARGKQLTDFENFKADLYGKLSNIVIDKLDIKEFKSKVDGEWLDFIWKLFDEEKAFEYTDVFCRNIFHWVFTTSLANKVAEKDKIKALINENCMIEDCYLDDYCKFGDDVFKECIIDFKCLFALLEAIKDPELIQDIKQEVFCGLINLDYMTYSQRVLMFVLIKFAKNNDNNIDVDALKKWWRVFKNLVNNTDIDKDQRFYDAIKAIDDFEKQQIDTDNIKSIKMFDKRQIVEEYLKLKLKEDSEWNNFICETEDTYKYFDGRIYFSFRLICNDLPVLSEPKDDIYATIDDEVKNISMDEYKNIWKIISKIFDQKGLIENLDEKFMFHRALLTFGDYSIKIRDREKDKRYTFFFEGNKGYFNWRRMLREEKSYKIFKNFIDEFKKSQQQNINDFMNTRINNYGQNSVGSDILSDEAIYYFVKYKELFEYMDKNIFCWDGQNDRIVLCAGESLSGKYVEFNTYTLNVLLNAGRYEYGTGYFDGKNTKAYFEYKGNEVVFESGKIKYNGNEYESINYAHEKLKKL